MNIYNLLENEKTAQELETHCGFLHRDFIKMTGECNLYNLAAVEEYAAQVIPLRAQIASLSDQNRALNTELSSILASNSWRLMKKLHNLRHKLLPYGSGRAMVASRLYRWLSGVKTR